MTAGAIMWKDTFAGVDTNRERVVANRIGGLPRQVVIDCLYISQLAQHQASDPLGEGKHRVSRNFGDEIFALFCG